MHELGHRERAFIIADRPDLNWMKRGILDPHGAVWLSIGWYTPKRARAAGSGLVVIGFRWWALMRRMLARC